MREVLATPGATRYILEKYGIRARKKYGQNFLIDANVIRGIIDAAQITQDDCVLEIGPGIGSMTQLLSGAAGKRRDRREPAAGAGGDAGRLR